MLVTELAGRTVPLQAKLRFQASRRVIHPGMNHAAVMAGLMLSGACFLFQHQQAFVRVGLLQLHGGGKAQYAAADNDEIPHECRYLCQIFKIY